MKLTDRGVFWHFTSPHHLEGCLRDGLALGVTPIRVNDKINFMHRHQWLTSDRYFIQEWCAGSHLPYDRTAFRLTVKIPRQERDKLLDYKAWRTLLGDRMVPNFDACHSVRNWWIFQGLIPRDWITAVDAKEGL